MGSNPSRFKGATNPVEGVSWEACQEFLKKLNKKTGRKFVLPSEAEWEYACRAGAASEFCFGDDDDALGDFGWYSSNSHGTTRPVGQKKPNAWGLYDMHGNVREWCEDAWHDSYQRAPTDGSAWSRGGDANGRVVRGGSWGNTAENCRAATRHRRDPSSVSQHDGFRVCLREF
jgi:formylglycine-generating enzyme required for sulfatase activity